ncbi:MAG: hypothetical protein ACOY0T_35085 [Myxococcota bacterium]
MLREKFVVPLVFAFHLLGLIETAAAQTEPAPATTATAPTAAPATTAEPGATPAVDAPTSPAAAPTPAPALVAPAPPALVAPDPARATDAPPAQLPTPPVPAPTQLKLELGNRTSIRFGLLWQGQYEARGNSVNNDISHNLFLRRFSILLGGTVLRDFEYFFDTDFADLMKAPAGDQSLKNGPGISTKDAFVTFRAIDDKLKIDAGLFIPPGAHNVLQGGSSIYSWDFFLNTFRHNTVFGSTGNPYGRDLGAELRGIVGPIEYRAGIFQGKRRPPSAESAPARNSFRLAGRVQVNFLDPEVNFFYGGTYLGTKKIFSIGAAADFQYDKDGSYRTIAGDAFLDLPIGKDAITAQVNVVHRNGGDLVALPKQTAFMAEAGYRLDSLKLSPIARFEQRWGEGAAGDETDFGGGLAFWAYGHNSNLKAFYTRLVPDGSAAYDQFNLQWQVFFY